MGLLSAFAVFFACIGPSPNQQKPVQPVRPPTPTPFRLKPRFELASPLPTVPGVMVDSYSNGLGVAQQLARSYDLQARILWIDGTANIDKYNTEYKIID